MRSAIHPHVTGMTRLFRASMIAMLVLFAFPLRTLHADVFWRFRKQTRTQLSELGGTSVYQTPVEVNGAPGTLETYAFPGQSATDIQAALTRKLKLPKRPAFCGGFIEHVQDGRHQRILVLPSAAGAQSCAVFLFDHAKNVVPSTPVTWPNGLDALPGTPRFTAVCSATETMFVTAETSASPEAAARAASQILCQTGWTEMPTSTQTCKILANGMRTCVVFAMRHPKTEQTLLSVVRRNGQNVQR